MRVDTVEVYSALMHGTEIRLVEDYSLRQDERPVLVAEFDNARFRIRVDSIRLAGLLGAVEAWEKKQA